MNRRIIIIVLLIFLVSVVPAFASSESDPVEDPVNLEDIQQYIDDTNTMISANTEVLRITASDTSGFHSVILSLLGDYNPIVTDYEYRNNNNQYTSHSIEIEPDWSWIASAAIFAIVIFCVFRFIGGLFSRG